MRSDDLTPEQRAKADACKSPDEILALACDEGIELTVDEITEISGGDWSPKDGLPKCPACGSYAIHICPLPGTGCASCVCHDCGHQWTKTVLDPILPTK
jgi:hypothetical protein